MDALPCARGASGYRVGMDHEHEENGRRATREPRDGTPRSGWPALLVTLALLGVVAGVFILITWVRYTAP